MNPSPLNTPLLFLPSHDYSAAPWTMAQGRHRNLRRTTPLGGHSQSQSQLPVTRRRIKPDRRTLWDTIFIHFYLLSFFTLCVSKYVYRVRANLFLIMPGYNFVDVIGYTDRPLRPAYTLTITHAELNFYGNNRSWPWYGGRCEVHDFLYKLMFSWYSE